MGARQSIAQPSTAAASRQDGIEHGIHSSGHHSSTSNEASTSNSTNNAGGARPRLNLQSSSPRISGIRQSRSRSMAASSQMQAEAAALIAALNQQRRRANRLLTDAVTGSSDLSSDSEDGNDALMSTGTVRSLDRLLRFNSTTAVDAESSGSSSAGTRVWLPPVTFRCFEIKCPVCHKTIPFDDVECHLIMCLTRPKIIYNEEILTEDRDECVICFDDMSHGDTIARLPCLCVYHKTCIDGWFKVKNVCPAHPGDD